MFFVLGVWGGGGAAASFRDRDGGREGSGGVHTRGIFINVYTYGEICTTGTTCIQLVVQLVGKTCTTGTTGDN